MSFNTFGYNGTFEMRKEIVDKLLAQVYERNMVESNGKVSDDEFVTIDLGTTNGNRTVIYLKIGIPTVSFDPAPAKENTVDLRVPFDAAIFHRDQTGTWSRFIPPKLDLGISELSLSKAKSGGKSVIQPALKQLTGEQIKFFLTGFTSEFPDQTINDLLSIHNVPLTAADLKDEIAKQLSSGALKGMDIEIPSAGLQMKWLQNWDFRVVSKKDSKVNPIYDSVDILLYESELEGGGKGIQGDAGNTIPQGSSPPYSFALSMPQNILVDKYFKDFLDHQGGFYSKSMIVSSTGQTLTYALPAPPYGSSKKATISPPQNGKVTVTIPKDGLSAHSRVRLENVTAKNAISFEANGSGAATVSINAGKGDTLKLIVEALSYPQDTNTVVWRPSISLHDGKLHLNFHYYHYVSGFCDIEDDGWADIGLKADLSQVFAIKPYVIDQDFDLPWWADLLSFLAGFILMGLMGGLVATILVEVLGTKLINEFIGSKLDKNLQNQLKFPTPGSERLALFLEKVDVYSKGIVLSGYADTGMIEEYGRQEFDVAKDIVPKGYISLGHGYGGFILDCDKASLPGALEVISSASDLYHYSGSDAREQFWKAGYEEGKKASYTSYSAKMQPSKPALLWINLEQERAKVLIEWDKKQGKVRATWVSFKEYVTPYVKIDNNVVGKQISGANLTIAYHMCFSYSGYLSLDTRKFFRTAITREAGLERWFWNGKEIEQDGSVTGPGLEVTWDTKKDRIIVDIDQAKLKPGLPKPKSSGLALNIPNSHLVEYEGEDAFGQKKKAQLTLYTPPCVTESMKLLVMPWWLRMGFSEPPPWGEEGPPWPDEIPLPDGFPPQNGVHPVARLPHEQLTQLFMDVLSEQVGRGPAVWKLSEVLSTALEEGQAQIDTPTAKLLLSILAEKA